MVFIGVLFGYEIAGFVLAIVFFLCVCIVLLHLLLLYGLYFLSTYDVSFGPLEVGYKAYLLTYLLTP
jgi:hypothetical protein